METTRYVVDRTGQVREEPVQNGRVEGFTPGKDRFHFASKAEADAKALEIQAAHEGREVTRGQ